MNQTTNAVIAERQNAVQENIRELQKKTPGLSYEAAHAECKKLPEMQHIFGAMKQPEALSAPGRNPEQMKASAQFQGKVQAAMHSRGINYPAAWAACLAEYPELAKAMTGDNDPVKKIKDSMSWID